MAVSGVRIVQARLAALGFLRAVDVDGNWGTITNTAFDRALPAPVATSVDPILVSDLMRDEGIRLKAYPDPLSPRAKAIAAGRSGEGLSGAPWTIGYGHTGVDVYEGLTWTQDQAYSALLKDVAEHNSVLSRVLPWVADLDPVRRRVVQNMHFNMGWDNPRTPALEGLAGFVNTLRYVREGRWADAAQGMAASLWYRQTGDRAKRLVKQMLEGPA